MITRLSIQSELICPEIGSRLEKLPAYVQCDQILRYYEMMENQTFNVSMDVMSRDSVVIDENSAHTTMNSLVQSCSFDLNDQNHMMVQLHSTIQEPISGDVTNRTEIISPNAFYTCHRRNIDRDATLGCSSATANSVFQEQPISAASVANFLAERNGLQENLNNLAISVPPIYSSEVLAECISNGWCSSLNYRLAPSMNCDDALGSIGGQSDIQKYPATSDFGGKTSLRTEFQPYSFVGNMDPCGWISSNSASVAADHSNSYSKFSNELSLTLATSQPSFISGMNIPGQCSEMTCSGVAHNSLNETRFASEQTSCNSEGLSLSFGSYRPPQFSQVILGSRYLCVIQEILAQIASYSLENLDLQTTYPTAGASDGVNVAFYSNSNSERASAPEVAMEPALQRPAVERKKAKLLALLQTVC